MTTTIEPSSTLGAFLTQDQKDYFKRTGLIHFRNFIDRETVDLLWSACVEVQQEWITGAREKVNGTPVNWGVDVNGERIVQRFAFANQFSPVLARFLLDPRFNLLLELVGNGARLGVDEKDGLVVNHYVNSDSSKFTRMGWHTDSVRDLFMGKPVMPMLNVGIHLDDQDPRNGGLRLIPGSQEQGVWGMLTKKLSFFDHRADPREVAFEIKAGDLTVHDGRCWHRVERSTLVGTASRRRVMYIPIIAGAYEPRGADSPTPIYHHLSRFIG